MRAVIQKVKKASCTVENEVTGQIGQGLVVLLGITHDDTEKDIEHLAEKIINLRLFATEDKYFEKSLLDVQGELLVISQFTLYADTSKGRRPSFTEAAKPEEANELYKKFIETLKEKGVKTEQGVFGAMMDIELLNSGPVTIIVDSKQI